MSDSNIREETGVTDTHLLYSGLNHTHGRREDVPTQGGERHNHSAWSSF